jgi:hypothetical protein
MKYLKMLGLAVVAVAALMAFAGAGTASADELCTTAAEGTDEPPTTMCPAGKQITVIHASLIGSAKLEDTEGTVLDTCTAGTVRIVVTNQGTGVRPIKGSIAKEELTWGETGTNCTFPTKTIAGGTVEATEAAGGGTTVTAKSAEVTINTVLFGSCVYGAGTGTHLGSTPNGGNELSINATVNKISGGFACPSTTKWNAKYKITNHTAVFYIKN